MHQLRFYCIQYFLFATQLFVFIKVDALSSTTSAFNNQIDTNIRCHDDRAPVKVWDNTLRPETVSILHNQASQRGLGHSIFKRSSDRSILSPIEQTLDNLLTSLNDTSPIVEYWSRQEWRHIEAHADIDELLVRDQQKQQTPMNDLTFRFPKNGHVLYLQVGSSVQGPTCLFPKCHFGSDLLGKTDDKNDNNEVSVITVPAVPSRLLRFQGDLLHAVPRPADLWFRKFVVGTGETEPEEEWGRSVILFNTWRDEDDGPLNVLPESINEETSVTDRTKLEARSVEEWQEMPIHQHMSDKIMNPDSEDEECLNNEDEMDYSTAKVWLLGDYARRNCQTRTVKLFAPESQMRKALEDRSTVYETFLRTT